MEKVTIEKADLYCGDCLDVFPLVGGVDLILTDPPYSSGGAYRSDRTQTTDKKYQHTAETTRSYATFSGDNRDQRSFEKWCAEWMRGCLDITNEGGVIGAFIDWRNIASVIDAMQVAGWVYRGVVPWHKGEDQRPRKGWFRANVEYVVLGSAGPMLTGHKADGLCADGVVYCRINGNEKLHQTGKPIDLMTYLMQVRGDWDVVFDPFMGSGTTGVAALNLGKKFIGVEKEKHYFDVACSRIKAERAQGRLAI